jgi:hypothetical protein
MSYEFPLDNLSLLANAGALSALAGYWLAIWLDV